MAFVIIITGLTADGLLERPFQEVLDSGQPDFPFCLCWANENWTRRWDGLDKEILMGQAYSEQDDRRHIQWLSGVFPRSALYSRCREAAIFGVPNFGSPQSLRERLRFGGRKPIG